jgi:hypothetical protein
MTASAPIPAALAVILSVAVERALPIIYLEPPGDDRIIGNHYIPRHPGKYCGKKPKHGCRCTNLSKCFHGFFFLAIPNEISADK